MIDFLRNAALWLSLFFMLLGLFGLVVPIFPGLFIMWLSALGYGVARGFNTFGVVLFALITLLAIGGSLADNLLMGAGARRGGASWGTILVALLAAIAGTLLFPPVGGLIAAPLAVLLLEYLRLRDWEQAWQALRGLAVGWGVGTIFRLIAGLLILLLWGLWVWKG